MQVQDLIEGFEAGFKVGLIGLQLRIRVSAWGLYELWYKLLKGGYIEDSIGA